MQKVNCESREPFIEIDIQKSRFMIFNFRFLRYYISDYYFFFFFWTDNITNLSAFFFFLEYELHRKTPY